MLDAGYWILDAGYWILDAGYWILDAGYWMLDAGYWILDAGYWIVLGPSTGSGQVVGWIFDMRYLISILPIVDVNFRFTRLLNLTSKINRIV